MWPGLALRPFSGQKSLAFLSAVLFVIYPIDYTRMRFTRIYHWEIYLVVLLGRIHPVSSSPLPARISPTVPWRTRHCYDCL